MTSLSSLSPWLSAPLTLWESQDSSSLASWSPWEGESGDFPPRVYPVLIPVVCDLGCRLSFTVSCRGHELQTALETRVFHRGNWHLFPPTQKDVFTAGGVCQSVKPAFTECPGILSSVSQSTEPILVKGPTCFAREFAIMLTTNPSSPGADSWALFLSQLSPSLWERSQVLETGRDVFCLGVLMQLCLKLCCDYCHVKTFSQCFTVEVCEK